MKRSIVPLVLLLSLVAAGCARRGAADLGPVPGGRPSSLATEASPTPATGSTPTHTGASSAPSATSGETMTFEVWFVRGEHLFVTHRAEAFSPRVGSAAVFALLEGPTKGEREAGISTAVPEGVELLGLTIDGGVASVDLTSTFGSGGGSLSMFLRLAELTFTLTQFRTVDSVVLSLDGHRVGVFSGEGIVIDRPLTRAQFREYVPAILVEAPAIGDRVPSPITIAGIADVFEATVSIAILDASGREIVRTFTTATCGTGCRGGFSAAVRYDVSHEQSGTVRVYESSAKDGSALNVVDVPVVLVP
jgi:immunoglobulin-like protein involved in spore germination/sporulation and spore germination protein